MQIIHMCNQRVTLMLARIVFSQTLVVLRNVEVGLACRPAKRPGLGGGSKPAASTTGQSYLRLRASLGSQQNRVQPGTRAIKGNIRRYYKLLTSQTTRSLGSRFLPAPLPWPTLQKFISLTWHPALMHIYNVFNE